MRIVSPIAVNLIKRKEGLRLEAYPDPGTGGVPWTIGYGHIRGVAPGQVIDLLTAEQYLQEDIDEAIVTIYRYCPASIIDALPQACFDALVSFVLNVGAQAFRNPKNGKETDFYRALTSGDLAKVPPQMMRWIYANGKVLEGLRTRRSEEAELWTTGIKASEQRVAISEVPDTAGVIPEAPPREAPASATPVAVGSAVGGTAVVATTLTQAGTSLTMSDDRIALLLGLMLILVGAGILLWVAKRK